MSNCFGCKDFKLTAMFTPLLSLVDKMNVAESLEIV